MKKGNVLALVAFIIGLAWVFTLDEKARKEIHSRVLGWFTPAFKVQSAVARDPEEAADAKRDPRDLAAEKAQLRRDLNELKLFKERSMRLEAEVKQLSSMLGFMRKSEDLMIPARVIDRTTSNWWQSLVIDKGEEDGIFPDLPVRNEVGIIGKTAQVSARTAKVILLTDEQCRVAARVENTFEQGIVTGNRSRGGGQVKLRMLFLSKDAALPQGLRVISSGAGGVFPEGVLLGTVREFIAGDLYGEAILDATVDLSSIRNLFVIVPDLAMEDAALGSLKSRPAGEQGSRVLKAVPLHIHEAKNIPGELLPEQGGDEGRASDE